MDAQQEMAIDGIFWDRYHEAKDVNDTCPRRRGLEAVARHVLANDETVARWRGHLGIMAEPTPASMERVNTAIERLNAAIEDMVRVRERVARLEGLEASRRAAKDAVTDGDELPDRFLCIYCSKALTLGDLTEDHIYCMSCWAKRLAVIGRMAADADTPPKVRGTPTLIPVCHDCWTKLAVQGVVGEDGRAVYCRDCWTKRDNANARMAGRV